MQSLSLRCNLQRCNLDGSLEMSVEKCVLTNNSPCYYLLVKTNDEGKPEDAWRKFDAFVTKKAGTKPQA